MPVATRAPNVGGHAFADAGDGEERFGVGRGSEGGELSGLLLDGLGGAAVGADAEGVGGVDLEQCGGFVEQAGDGDIVHGDTIRVRGRIRTLSQYATESRVTQGERCVSKERSWELLRQERRLVTNQNYGFAW